MDDTDCSNQGYLWNIYYHLFLDKDSLNLVQTQSQKLYTLSTSIKCWHDSKYGTFLRFCDQGTLATIREIWMSYCTMELSTDEKTSYDERFKSGIQKAKDAKFRFTGHGTVLTGFRSAAPVVTRSLRDLTELHEQFWDHGIMDRAPEVMTKAKHPNPMFASLLTDTFTLHYGTDPLLGFNLATAYIPFVSGSPLYLESSSNSHLPKAVRAARLQFRVWCESFRRSALQGLKIRFLAGDALAFCHTLQHKQLSAASISANWYRAQYDLNQLILDGEDYTTTGKAPLSFNVIDTSNLMDHIGAINLLVAASPLLDRSLSATLYTESLVKRAQNHRAFIDDLLCGHFPTISILLGLFPIEYWTKVTTTFSVDEAILDAIVTGSSEDNKGQMYSRLTWKRPLSSSSGTRQPMNIPRVHFTETALAQILHQVYVNMFQHEDMSVLLSKIDLLTIRNNSSPPYHRGSLASFLCYIKKRVVLDWDKLMGAFLDLIEKTSNIALGGNYIQELYLQLHLLGLYTVSALRLPFNRNSNNQAKRGISAWNHIPEVVCVTLKVPRAKLGVFTELPVNELGMPLLHCSLQSSHTYRGKPWQNLFADVHLAFGQATTSGSRSDDGFRVNVTGDRHGWKGRSPMFISFYAPSWVISQDAQATRVALGVGPTPLATKTFMKVLGLEMKVYETNLGNEDNVYITKHPPNQSGHASVCGFAGGDEVTQGTSDEAVRTTIAANVDLKTARITAMTGRVIVLSEDVKSSLRNGAGVETIQISPCIIAVVIGKSAQRYHLYFPTPVLRSLSRARIARKSSYVEVVAPLCGTVDVDRFPTLMYPVFSDGRHPVIWNMPQVNLKRLPILDITKTEDMRWLVPHTSSMFSTRERMAREKTMVPGAEIQKDVRINFKDSLFSMFMHFSGLQGGRSSVFGLSNPTQGGVHVLVFVSCLRLDIANHTVVLDAAILPLTNGLMPHIHNFLVALTDAGICQIQVDSDELRLWKQVIPAMTERCRQWAHRSSCDYLGRSQIPLSVENGQTPICSCGNGTLPAKFISDIPDWDSVSRYAVRAAISPSFSVPFVEPVGPVHGGLGITTPSGPHADLCKVCGRGKSSSGTNLLKCGRCHGVKYCSAGCQRADWKEHKKICATKSDIQQR